MSGGKPKPKSMGMPKPHPSHMSSPGESPGESAAHTGKQGKLSAYANTFSTSSLPSDTPPFLLSVDLSHYRLSVSHTNISSVHRTNANHQLSPHLCSIGDNS
jgi:hypothetical protein